MGKQTLAERVGKVLTAEEQNELAFQLKEIGSTFALKGIGRSSSKIGLKIVELAQELEVK